MTRAFIPHHDVSVGLDHVSPRQRLRFIAVSAETEEAVPPEPESSPRLWRRGPRRPDLLWLTVAAAGATALAVVVLRTWRGQLHVPFTQGGDAAYGLLLIKSVITHGWLGINHDIGAPYGGVLYDHTVAYGDTTQLLIIKLLGLGSSDPAAILNVFFLLTFALCAMTAFAVLRSLRFGGAISAGCAIVFALLPYHFARGQSHVMLAAYFSVPIGCWLVLGTLGHARLFEPRAQPRHHLFAWASRRTMLTIAAAVVVGISEIYYAVFTLLIVSVCAALLVIARRSLRVALPAIAVCTVVFGSAVAVQLPEIIYHRSHGSNTVVGQRSPGESEYFGLKLAALVIPVPDHRIHAMGKIGDRYFAKTPLPGEGTSPALGTLMTIGFLFALLTAAAAAVGGTAASARTRMVRDAGVASGVALTLGTVGGGSALIAYLVSSQVRGWDRISVFIAFFAVIGLASLLSWVTDRLRRRPTWITAALLLAVPLFAAWDQTPRHVVPDYAASLASWRSDGRFAAQADELLPPRAAILQLPYVPFPENPPVFNMADYDELKVYAHDVDLRWSYGAIKGRDPDQWGASMVGVPMRDLVPAAVAAGFSAIYVDRNGYGDHGDAIVREISKAVGAAPAFGSEDGRLVLFDLSGVEAQLSAAPSRTRALGAAALVRPIVQAWTDGFYSPAEGDGKRSWYWSRARGRLKLVNSAAFARRVTLSFALRTPGPQPQRVQLELPRGGVRRFVTKPGADVAQSVSLVLAPGTSSLTFSTDAPDDTSNARDLRLQVIEPRLTDAGYARLARARLRLR